MFQKVSRLSFGLLLCLAVITSAITGCGGGTADDPFNPYPAENKTANAVGVNARITMPTSDVTLSFRRAAINWKSISMTIGGVSIPPQGTPTLNGANYEIDFTLPSIGITQMVRDANGFAKLRIYISGSEVSSADVLVSDLVPGDSSITTAVTSIRATIRSTGTNFTMENLTYTAPTSTAAVPVTPTPTVPGGVILLAEAIEYYRNGTWYHLNGATNVPAVGTQLRIRFNLEVESALTFFTINAQGRSSSVILNQNSLGSDLSAIAESDNKTLTFTLTGGYASRLVSGRTYSLTYQSSSIQQRGNPAVRLSTPVGTAVSFTVL